tara:strand:- start:5609 stop:5911 length:303 start_codon:yes stop_codon:yes gene_type:complete
MSKLKEIKYSYAEVMEKLIVPRLVWEKPNHDSENSDGEATLVQVPLPDEIKDYLMEAATKADERLREQVPEVDNVTAKASDVLPIIKPITTKLRKIGGQG